MREDTCNEEQKREVAAYAVKLAMFLFFLVSHRMSFATERTISQRIRVFTIILRNPQNKEAEFG
jgi:hypothetical protein